MDDERKAKLRSIMSVDRNGLMVEEQRELFDALDAAEARECPREWLEVGRCQECGNMTDETHHRDRDGKEVCRPCHDLDALREVIREIHGQLNIRLNRNTGVDPIGPLDHWVMLMRGLAGDLLGGWRWTLTCSRNVTAADLLTWLKIRA